jgi:peptidoglycan/LPS O-acetylase OafA/YrhL
MNENPNTRNDTQFLRSIAILLIINSHLDSFYPLSFLGTGGAIGNCLFLSLSAFGLYLSEKQRPKSFTDYYGRRIKRIYPAIWIFVIFIRFPLDIVNKEFTISEILPFLGNMFYPPNWFLRAIMIYYVIIFFIIKRYSFKKLLTTFIVVFIFYLYCYIFILDKSYFSALDTGYSFVFYFLPFLFGVFLAERNKKIKYSGLTDYFLLGISVGLMYGHKYLMFKGLLSQFQLVQLLLLFPTVYYFLKISRSDFIKNKVMCMPIISGVFRLLYTTTLELYIVHESLHGPVYHLKIMFPLNIAIYLSISIFVAVLVHKAANFITLNLFSPGKLKPA